MKKLTLVLLAVVTIFSCQKDCVPGRLHFSWVGFSMEEVDTVILRRYYNGQMGAGPIDTVFYGGPDVEYVVTGDTFDFRHLPVDFVLHSGYGYEVWLPGPQLLFTITQIEEENLSGGRGLFSCNKDLCMNSMKAATINGTRIPTTATDQVYISR